MIQINNVTSVVKQYINSDSFIRNNHSYQLFLLKVARISDSEFGIPPVDELAKILGLRVKRANRYVVSLKARDAWPFITKRQISAVSPYPKRENEELRVKAARLAKMRNLGMAIKDEDIDNCIDSLENSDSCDMQPNLS